MHWTQVAVCGRSFHDAFGLNCKNGPTTEPNALPCQWGKGVNVVLLFVCNLT